MLLTGQDPASQVVSEKIPKLSHDEFWVFIHEGIAELDEVVDELGVFPVPLVLLQMQGNSL